MRFNIFEVKKIILFFLLFCIHNSFSQDLLITYKISTIDELIDISKNNELRDNNIDQESIDLFQNAFRLINSMNAKLIVNTKESFFEFDKNVSNDANLELYSMAEIMVGSKNRYYCNLQENQINKAIHAFGENFVILKSISEIKWKLTKDRKKIGNFECYKAETEYVTENAAGRFQKKVIAWYTKDLPYNFGPAGYCGLPGLIIELIDDKIRYSVIQIENYEAEKIDNLISYGESVTTQEFQTISERVAKERNERFLNRQ